MTRAVDQPRADSPAAPVACGPSCRDAPVPWLRLIIGAFVAAQAMTFDIAVGITPPEEPSVRLAVHGALLAATALVMILLGSPLLREALAQLAARRITMELLFMAGITASLAVSLRSAFAGHGPLYFNVVNLLLVVYSAGHAINAIGRDRALRSLRSLTAPLATARTENGLVPTDSILPGQRIIVLPGELIPVDGVIVAGHAMVRQTPFTGEWIPAIRHPGETVLAGAACEDGTLTIESTAPGDARRVDRLARLIAQAAESPSALQRQADRLVRWFLPLVLIVSAGTLAYWGWSEGLMHALAVLVVACPCAAGLATPLAVWSAMGQLAARGLIVQAGDAIERLASVDAVLFDKTGTLSADRLAVVSIATPEDPIARATALAAIAAVERQSDHPVARALRDLPQAAGAPPVEVLALRIHSGKGIEAQVRIDRAAPATLAILRDPDREPPGRLRLAATLDGAWAATITLAESFRESAAPAIERLRAMGLHVAIFTGDPAPAREAHDLAPISSGMTPEEKHAAVLALRRRALFVGDGLNDAAAMAAAHASIALPGGAEIAAEAASSLLQSGDLAAIPEAIELSRRTLRTIRGNLLWAAAYNAAGLCLAATGLLHPVVAAILMAISSALVAWRSQSAAGVLTGGTEPPEAISSEETPDVHPGLRGERHPVAVPSAGEDTGGTGNQQPATSNSSYSLVTTTALLAQGLLLAALAGTSAVASAAIVILFALAAWLILRPSFRPSPALDMTLGMISVGGFGMNLGWWIDQGLAPVSTFACCAPSLPHSIAGSPWMYFGMLALGVPAMYVVRKTSEPFTLRSWCCTGGLLLGVPLMAAGMWLGAWLAGQLPYLPPAPRVLAHYLFMMAGMSLGMLLPHALPRARA